MFTDPHLIALFGSEFFARSLVPELQNLGLLPSIWGLWGLSYAIAFSPSQSEITKLAGGAGLVMGIVCSEYPLLLSICLSAAAWASFAINSRWRISPGFLIASVAMSFSLLAKLFFWSILVLTGNFPLKPLYLESLAKAGFGIWFKRALLDGASALIAWRLCSSRGWERSKQGRELR